MLFKITLVPNCYSSRLLSHTFSLVTMVPIGVYYAVALAALLAVMLLYLGWRIFLNCYFAYVRPWWLVHVVYPSFQPHHLNIKIILKPRVMGPIIYFAGTAIFNLIGVNTISEAGIRAARLSIFTLLLLFWAGDHEFGARLLGIASGTYQYIHRISAIMAVLQGAIHVAIKSQEIQFSYSDTVQIYGLIVSLFVSDNGGD